jgi:xanthine dehydrogenase YagT iron-sulfur-binding subunit
MLRNGTVEMFACSVFHAPNQGSAIPRGCLSRASNSEARKDLVVYININGSKAPLPDDARVSLLDLLREHLHLSGAKKGCDQGACGACTVLVDGSERILSCLALAVQYEGRSITSIEGLAVNGTLHPLQRAFIEHDGLQCGYCTPGQICSAIGMAEEVRRGVPSHVTQDLSKGTIVLTFDELRERMSGNLCRCGAYNGIAAAITENHEEAAI